MSQKRPATSEVAEPADKRSRAAEVPPADVEMQADRPKRPADDLLIHPTHRPGGILNSLAREIHGPIPVHADANITVNTANMEDYIDSVRVALIDAIYPGIEAPADMVTEADWRIVIRSILKSRVDHVYSSVTGLRPNQRIPMPRQFELPKCISDLANSIGMITVLKGGLRVIPQPEVAGQGVDPLVNLFTLARIQSAARLIQAAKVRGIINTGFLSSVVDGTAWWCMSARQAANQNVVANGIANVGVVAIFPEWTPADALLCAIVQNQYDGLFGDIAAMYWSAGFVTSIGAIRNSYNLGA